MATRDFDKEIARETIVREDPIEFKLFDETWHCRDDVNGKLLMDRAADLNSDSLMDQRAGVVGVFQMTVITEEIDDLTDLLDDPDKVIQLAKLVEIVGWLVEEYTERPTAPPSPSRRGGTPAGRTSQAKPRVRASRSVRSVPASS